MENGYMMTFRQLKQCNLIDIRAFYDTEEYGIRAKHSYVELSRSIPHEQLFYYAIPCYNEGVYWYSKGKYIYWKLQEVNSSEHFISVYLRYYFLNDGIWSCGPSGTVKYVLNSTSGIEGCEIICQKEYSSEDLLFLLNDKIVGWNKIEANIWDQAKREYATLLKNSWKEQNIDEHEATLIRPFLVNTIFLSIQLVKNKVSCPKSSVKKGAVLPQTAPVGTSNAERPVRIVGDISIKAEHAPRNPCTMRNFHVDAWKTRGHMRTYKSGKTVYIKETTHHRKAHNGDAQNVKMIVKSLKE